MTTSPSSKKPTFVKVFLPIGVLLLLIIVGLAVIKLTLKGGGVGSLHSPLNDGEGTAQNFTPEVGSFAPDVEMTLLDGKQLPFSQIKGKLFLINFWATWCEACLEEMPSLVKLRESYKNQGFEVVGVNLDENSERAVPKIAHQYKIQFPIFKDPDGQVADVFNVHAIPLTVIVNKDRKVLLIQDGVRDWNDSDFRSQIEAWLK